MVVKGRTSSSHCLPLLLNVFGKHAEHCAAKSVDGWQITVPIKMLVKLLLLLAITEMKGVNKAK